MSETPPDTAGDVTDSGRVPADAPDGVVDARGLRCPAPVIRLARAAKDASPGTVLTVWWTDPAARHDIPAWARMRGHTVIGTDPLPDAADAYATHLQLTTPTPGDHAARA